MSRRLPSVFAVLALLGLFTAYVPDMGRGFVKDDFAWIAGSRVAGPAGILELFRRDNGFYRPLVSLSFTLDEWLHGLRPFGYAVTNLLLVVLIAVSLARLARALGLGGAAALAAACLWAFNPHGVGGAVMWISGRTALLLTLWAVLAALALARGRLPAAALFVFLALLCKEEATLLPAVLALWAAIGLRPGERCGPRRGLLALAAFAPGLAVYLLLRAHTHAYWPHHAPDYYRPTLDPATLLRNALEYADRAATFPAAVALLAALLARAWPRLDAAARHVITLGLVWLAGGYGLTLFLPVRSDLYACLPSVGGALAGAALLDGLPRAKDPRARRRLALASGVALLALVALLHSRNLRLRRTAELSARALAAVSTAAPELAAGTPLVLRDSDARINLRSAFGTLAETAVRLHTGVASAQVWIEPPPPPERGGGSRPKGARIEFELRSGDLTRVR